MSRSSDPPAERDLPAPGTTTRAAGDRPPDAAGPTPREVYSRGFAEATEEAARWARRANLVSNARLACFAAMALVGWLGFGTHALARGWVALPAALFVGLIVVHERVLRRRARAERVQRFYADGLARLDESWAGRGDAGERYLDPTHPYAADLDIFGRGSLFELLATTRTTGGSDRLASWLASGAPTPVIRARQAAVQELRPRVDLRREMAIAGDESDSRDQQRALASWAGAASAGLSPAIGLAAIAATSLSLGGLALWIFTAAGPVPFVAALLLQGALGLAVRGRVRPVLAAAETPVGALARTASLLACVEDERFESPRLVELEAALRTTGRPPSQELAALLALVDRRDARQNQFFAPIAALLMWGTHTALALERWRARCGPRLADWVDAASEIEALCALAGYAYEHPDDPFPEIVDEGPILHGEALGHPLLPAARCVRNDLELGGEAPRAYVVSGSNMSGKSTMLRTVGCNAVLAFAGAPVRARRLRISPLQIAASIRIVDSLQQGQSHFMAEITRLRQIVEIARGEPPALFLLDEILHGTNSHDRRIGAEAVIRGLVELGAIGLVTTHDLALTRIVEASGGRLANVHFEDHFEDGVMKFDYRLREGVVEKSNALALMRSVGLDV